MKCSLVFTFTAVSQPLVSIFLARRHKIEIKKKENVGEHDHDDHDDDDKLIKRILTRIELPFAWNE